jgi:hypothetical protein
VWSSIGTHRSGMINPRDKSYKGRDIHDFWFGDTSIGDTSSLRSMCQLRGGSLSYTKCPLKLIKLYNLLVGKLFWQFLTIYSCVIDLWNSEIHWWAWLHIINTKRTTFFKHKHFYIKIEYNYVTSTAQQQHKLQNRTKTTLAHHQHQYIRTAFAYQLP